MGGLKYSSNRAHTYLGDPKWSYCSKEKDEENSFPITRGFAARFGVKCERVLHQEGPGCGDEAHAGGERALRPRRDGALHRDTVADDSRRRQIQGRYHGARSETAFEEAEVIIPKFEAGEGGRFREKGSRRAVACAMAAPDWRFDNGDGLCLIARRSMLSEDREYMRSGRPGAAASGPSPVTVLIWINVIVFVLQNVFEVWVTKTYNPIGQLVAVNPAGAVSREALANGDWYLLITHLFVHSNTNYFHIIANMLMIYFIGKKVLGFFGTGNFLAVYFLGGIAGSLLQLSVSAPDQMLIGASGAGCALVGAFSTILPDVEIFARLYFVVPVRLRAKYLGMGLALASLVLFLIDRAFGLSAGIGHLAHLGGCVMGWYYARVLGYGGKAFPFFGLNKRKAAAERPDRARGWVCRGRTTAGRSGSGRRKSWTRRWWMGRSCPRRSMRCWTRSAGKDSRA